MLHADEGEVRRRVKENGTPCRNADSAHCTIRWCSREANWGYLCSILGCATSRGAACSSHYYPSEAQRWCILRTKRTTKRLRKDCWERDSNAVPFPRPLLLLGDARSVLRKR